MDEFEIIEKFFSPLAAGLPGAYGLKDDGAVLSPPNGQDIVIVSDTLNEAVHFLADDPPDLIARKALRVNLSDLLAMGAKPFIYQLNLVLPDHWNESWLSSFARGLAKDQKRYGILLSGGDTTSVKGAGSVSITALGLVPKGKALRRSGARAGDYLYVTGEIGEAYLGLNCLKGNLENITGQERFIEKYRLPQPRVAMVEILHKYAHAAIDISDGFVADLEHLCRASSVSAVCKLEEIPFSDAAEQLMKEGRVSAEQLLTGGDDYELLIAVPPEQDKVFREEAQEKGVLPVHIAVLGPQADSPVEILDDTGTKLFFEKTGWKHL